MESETLGDIADAIRWVGAGEETYRPAEMAPAIRGLAWGSGEAYGLLMRPEEEGGLRGLWFARSLREPEPGMECRGRVIEQVFPGVEDLEYKSQGDLPWWPWCDTIGEVRFLDVVKPKRATIWFGAFHKCASFDLAKMDTSLLEDMNMMFFNCGSARTLDLSGFDTSRVKSVSCMFQYCQKLESLQMGAWDMRALTDMSSAFYRVSAIEQIDLSEWQMPESAPNIEAAFSLCRELRTIYAPAGCDLGDPNRRVYCFKQCEKLVGGAGTACDGEAEVLSDRAHVDGLDGRPGYFTAKE